MLLGCDMDIKDTWTAARIVDLFILDSADAALIQ